MVLRHLLPRIVRSCDLLRDRPVRDMVNSTAQLNSLDSADCAHLHQTDEKGAKHTACRGSSSNATLHAALLDDG